MTTAVPPPSAATTLTCTCGNRYGLEETMEVSSSTTKHITQPLQRHKDTPTNLVSSSSSAFPLDASFVHIPPSLLMRQEEENGSYLNFRAQQNHNNSRLSGDLWNGSNSGSYCYYSYLHTAGTNTPLLLLPEHYKHLANLEQAAAGTPNVSCSLCLDCIHRVQRALELDTDRLQAECVVYRQAVQEKDMRWKDWKRVVSSRGSSTNNTAAGAATVSPVAMKANETKRSSTDDDNDAATISSKEIDDKRSDELIQRAKQAFQLEIDTLQETCRQHEDELLHLQSIRKDLLRVSREIDETEETMNEQRNALALEARAFQYDQEQCHRILSDIHQESERLSSPAIRLPSLLLELQVDKERGLRYPLINNLRLAYRPKGDVQWEEIQAAWSLAAQLLLYVGTIFEFQSRNWRIVPLSSSAKLIFHPSGDTPDKEGAKRSSKGTVVYNLGHPKTHNSRALLAWNALLHQLASCVLARMNEACDQGLMDTDTIPRLAYEMTSTKIGTIVLTELNDSDDTGWSRAIHCMSSNLLWMSDCASVYLLHQIIPQCIV